MVVNTMWFLEYCWIEGFGIYLEAVLSLLPCGLPIHGGLLFERERKRERERGREREKRRRRRRRRRRKEEEKEEEEEEEERMEETHNQM
jgi:hypothetical protein